MAISILNNIPSLAAQNQLAMTQASLQKTLEQLSSGSRINSGADDAALQRVHTLGQPPSAAAASSSGPAARTARRPRVARGVGHQAACWRWGRPR